MCVEREGAREGGEREIKSGLERAGLERAVLCLSILSSWGLAGFRTGLLTGGAPWRT